jgi:hypothetical protein
VVPAELEQRLGRANAAVHAGVTRLRVGGRNAAGDLRHTIRRSPFSPGRVAGKGQYDPTGLLPLNHEVPPPA